MVKNVGFAFGNGRSEEGFMGCHRSLQNGQGGVSGHGKSDLGEVLGSWRGEACARNFAQDFPTALVTLHETRSQRTAGRRDWDAHCLGETMATA